MKTIVDVKFRIKPKRVNDPVAGKEVVSAKHLLITMRVRFGSMRLEFSTGYNIDAEFWDAKAGHSIGMGEIDHDFTRQHSLFFSHRLVATIHKLSKYIGKDKAERTCRSPFQQGCKSPTCR